MAFIFLFAIMTLLTGVVEAQAQQRTLDNGVLVVGVDLSRGGAINELRESGSANSLVNIHDAGRYIQQSYYGYPIPFLPTGATMHPTYPNWGWNPVQAGDVYGTMSQLTNTSNDGTTLYVKCVPKQWALYNVVSECTMETWITLDENRVHVTNRLVNDRTDLATPGALHQELPAVYTVGTLHRLMTYTGQAPFTGDSLTQITNYGPPWADWNSTENWSALVDDADWGLGVYLPGATLTIGGFHGVPNTGGPHDNSTGYIAPLHRDLLDSDIVYEFSYTLIVGHLHDDIRSYVYTQPARYKPEYVFNRDRQHCAPVNVAGSSPPFGGFWPLDLAQADPQIILPTSQWDAAEVPAIFITAAYRAEANTAEIFFAGADGVFTGEKRLSFPVIPDGNLRTYQVDLSAHPLYTGSITRLRFDPLITATPGDEVDLYAFTTTSLSPVPVNLTASSNFLLRPNYPNPFNPRTTVRYQLTAAAPVDLRIFDVAGRLVRILLTATEQQSGPHEIIWDGQNAAGQPVSSGPYFARMTSRGMSQTIKMSLVQ